MIERYQHSEEKVHYLIREMFLAGVSTRRVGEVIAPILGEAPSPQTVFRVARSLDAEVSRFHRRSLNDGYCYLLLDDISLKVKGATGVKKRLVLCAYGITPQGEREIISFRQASAESKAQWEAFLRDLYDRGLEGNDLALILPCRKDRWPSRTAPSLGHSVSLCALAEMLGAQACGMWPLSYPGSSRSPASKGLKRFIRPPHVERHSSQPKAVSCLEADLDELLNFLSCPRAHWHKIRTTNAIERAFRQVRRRTRPMSCFQNTASVDRIIYGVINHLNSTWKDKPIPESTHFS